jgi:hypothetical protein
MENGLGAENGLSSSGSDCCAFCRYASYGKTTRQRGKGHFLKDFR